MENELYNPHLRTKKTTTVIMRDVCIALLPAAVAAVIFFGSKALTLMIISVLTCVLGEAIWQLLHNEPVAVKDFSAVVTGLLLAFNVSARTPIWALVLADLFAIIVVKQFFGGIGSNVFNPALMGRLFLMVVYPSTVMTYGLPGDVDTMTSATILSSLKQGTESAYSLLDAFIGKVPGALGETSALCLLIGFAYLVIRKEVNWKVSLSFFVTVFAIVTIAGQNPLMHLCSGGLVLGGCFMLTDYNFATNHGNVIYGVVAGILVAAIRIWGVYPEGVCYAILLTNAMVAIIDKIYPKHIYGISQNRRETK